MGTLDLTDGVWVFPEGYAHYLEKHDVKPPEEFLEDLRQRAFQIPKLAILPDD